MAAQTDAGRPEPPSQRPPGVILDLRGIPFTQVPNEVLDHWTSEQFPLTLRVMAYIVRNSFGYHTSCCMRRKEGEKPRPMQEKDLAEHFGLSRSRISKAIHELIANRLLWLNGRLLYAVANPSQFPAPILPATETGQAEADPRDPEYHQEIQEARAEYQQVLQRARAQLQQRLRLAELHYQARQAGASRVDESGNWGELPIPATSEPEKLPDSETESCRILKPKLPDSETRIIIEGKKFYKGERKRVGEELPGLSTREPPQPTPTHPLPDSESTKLQEAHEYLKGFTGEIGKAPDLQFAGEFVRRLKGASIEQVETLRKNRCATGLRLTSYGIFLKLADDCAASSEAFRSSHKPMTREQQQAEDYARRRHAQRKQA